MSETVAKVIGWAISSAGAAALMMFIWSEVFTPSMFASLWAFYFLTCVGYEIGNTIAAAIRARGETKT